MADGGFVEEFAPNSGYSMPIVTLASILLKLFWRVEVIVLCKTSLQVCPGQTCELQWQSAAAESVSRYEARRLDVSFMWQSQLCRSLFALAVLVGE